MGRKKIEIRPLVDERNRNVTFLKRKAGLMKKAWELSVLCGADVSILIFSAAGKAYEFSSQDLEGEIDRYMDYEGMIERRRAPEFAAMAALGEDDDDDEDDEVSRRGSVSKGKGSGGVPSGSGANGGNPAPSRSLKGKEVYKARTSRTSGTSANHKDAGRVKNKTKGKERQRDREKPATEKKSFIGAMLSGSESDEESDDEDVSADEIPSGKEERRVASSSKARSAPIAAERDRKKDKRAKREREEKRRPTEREQATPKSDAMAGIHYALNMHSGASQPSSAERAHIPREIHQTHYAASDRRSNSYSQADYGPHSQPPMVVPQLPRLPSDAISFRMPHAPTAPLPVHVPQLPMSSHSTHQSYGYASGSNAPSAFQHYSQQSFPSAGSGQYPLPYPPQQQHQQPIQSQLPTHDATGYLPTGQGVGGVQPDPSNMQWDANLLARYAEFQLQQNHQRQQRLLLERQRQQLAELGVPVDDRSLLDDIFGGIGAGNGAANNASVSARGTPGLSLDMQSQSGTGEFIWPLAEGSAHSGGGNTDIGLGGEGYTASGRDDRTGAELDWSFDGMDEGDRRTLAGGIPSPVSNSAGEMHKKGRGRESTGEMEGDLSSHKRIRV